MMFQFLPTCHRSLLCDHSNHSKGSAACVCIVHLVASREQADEGRGTILEQHQHHHTLIFYQTLRVVVKMHWSNYEGLLYTISVTGVLTSIFLPWKEVKSCQKPLLYFHSHASGSLCYSSKEDSAIARRRHDRLGSSSSAHGENRISRGVDQLIPGVHYGRGCLRVMQKPVESSNGERELL